MESIDCSDDNVQALEKARRQSAERLRLLLSEIEAAEREFKAATEKVDAVRLRNRPPVADADRCSREGRDDES